MKGLEILTGNKKLTILQCQSLAKEVGFDSTEFMIYGPKGKRKQSGWMLIWEYFRLTVKKVL